MRIHILQDPNTKEYISTRWTRMADQCRERGAATIVVLSGWNISPTFYGVKITAKEFCRRIDEKVPGEREPLDIREITQRRKGKIFAFTTSKDNQEETILKTEMYINDEVSSQTYKKFGVGVRVRFF